MKKSKEVRVWLQQVMIWSRDPKWLKRRPGPFKEEFGSLQPFSIEISKHLIGPIQAVQNLYHRQMSASVYHDTGVAGLNVALGGWGGLGEYQEGRCGGFLLSYTAQIEKERLQYIEATRVGFDGQAVGAGARPLFRDGSR